MAEADKPDSSTGKAKSKSSFLDEEIEDISKDFLSSWKSMSVTGGDDMDFNFEPVTKGKNKAFNFGMDMDFSLDDDAFGKMPSFNLDMPDIDFSSSPKKSSKSKEKKPEGQSAEESRQEKNGKFTFSFDFNGDGDNNENGKDGTMVIADAEPHGGQAKKDELHLLENEKTTINVKTSGDGPSSEGNGQRLHDNPSLRGQELKRDSVVEKREKNADILRNDDNNENEEIRTLMAVDSVSCDGQAEKDELHLPDNRKTSIDVKPSREKKISFVEAFGKIPTFKLDLPVADMYGSIKKSAKLKEKLSEKESAKGNHQEKSDKLSSPSRVTETINAGPTIEEERVVGVVETLGHDNFILDTAACSATNIPKPMNSEVVSTAEMQRSGLKDSPVPSESDDPSRDEQSLDGDTSSCAKEILKRESAVEERENNSHILRDVDNNANEDSRTNKTVHPVPRDGQAKNDGLHLLDNMKTSTDDKSSGSIRLPSLVTSKGLPKSSNQGNEKFKGKISRMPTVQKSNLAQANKLPLARIDKMMPSLPTLTISRNITPRKQSSSTILQDPNPMGNLERSSNLQVRSKMTSPVNAQTQTPSMPSLKRKPVEAADLLPSKRLSPSGSRMTKVSAKEFEDKVQTQSALSEGSKNDVVAENPSPKFDFHLDARMENLDFTLMVEGDVNVEKAEACAKELDNICNMLKKKHDEAKELLVRALVNNNNLLMLNHPIYEEKICKVQRFASRLMSREQEAGV